MGSLCANALMEKDGKESSQSKKQSAKRDKERLRRENIKKEAPLSDIIRANPHYTRFYELLRSFSTSSGWIHPPGASSTRRFPLQGCENFVPYKDIGPNR